MDFVGLGVLLVLALVFAFLAVRSWRARRLWVKLVAGIPTTLLAVVFVAALGLAIYGYSKVNRTYANPVADVKVAGTPAQIAQGERLMRIFCTSECRVIAEDLGVISDPVRQSLARLIIVWQPTAAFFHHPGTTAGCGDWRYGRGSGGTHPPARTQ